VSDSRSARQRLARAIDALNRFLLTGGDQRSVSYKMLLNEVRAAQRAVDRLKGERPV
jgi:hypothetical protein